MITARRPSDMCGCQILGAPSVQTCRTGQFARRCRASQPAASRLSVPGRADGPIPRVAGGCCGWRQPDESAGRPRPAMSRGRRGGCMLGREELLRPAARAIGTIAEDLFVAGVSPERTGYTLWMSQTAALTSLTGLEYGMANFEVPPPAGEPRVGNSIRSAHVPYPGFTPGPCSGLARLRGDCLGEATVGPEEMAHACPGSPVKAGAAIQTASRRSTRRCRFRRSSHTTGRRGVRMTGGWQGQDPGDPGSAAAGRWSIGGGERPDQGIAGAGDIRDGYW